MTVDPNASPEELVKAIAEALSRIPPISQGRIVLRCPVCRRAFTGVAHEGCEGCAALVQMFRLLVGHDAAD